MTTTRTRRRTRIDQRIMRDVLAALAEFPNPLSADQLRLLVHGQGTRVDAATRMLVAGGRVSRTRAGYELVRGGADDAA